MMLIGSRLAIGAILVAALAPIHAGSQTTTPARLVLGALAPDFSQLDALLDDSLAQVDSTRPGFALVLVHDGRVLYSRTAGRITPSTMVPIASASKWLAGAVIMSLVDEGRLSLGDTVGRFFPGVAPAIARITVRQLFSHTSGLPREAACLGSTAHSLGTCAEEILARAPRAVPGRRFAYGGASMQVAGRIAELAGGAPWEELFRRRVAEPLGLRRTAFSARPTQNPRIAGGAVSSAEDYLRFLAMIAGGGSADGARVLSTSAVRELLADQTRGAAMGTTPYDGARRDDTRIPRVRYGIGVWRETFALHDAEVTEHASPGALGFIPWYDPETGITGVFATVRPLAEVMPTVLEARRIIREAVRAAR